MPGNPMEKVKAHRIFSSVDADGNWKKHTSLKRYLWKGPATVSPLTGKKVRALVAIDQEGYYRAAIRNSGETIHEPPMLTLREYPGGKADILYCGAPCPDRAAAIDVANKLCSAVLVAHAEDMKFLLARKVVQTEAPVKQKPPRMVR